MSSQLLAVLGVHRLETKTQCGAISIPLVHHHAAETDRYPGPLRSLTCTQPAGHEGLHKDGVCCYNFQTFEDWQVVDRKPRTFDKCVGCNYSWPCQTIEAIQHAEQQVPA